MGADLLLAYIKIPKNQNLKKIKADMLGKVNMLNPDDVNEIEGYFNETYGENMMGRYKQNKIQECIKKTKNEFKKVIIETFNAITLPYRDVNIIEHKGDLICISGGMSWGDDPTESFRLFCKFNSLPPKILEMLER